MLGCARMTDTNIIPRDDFPYDIEVFATNLFIPWAIDISTDGKMYITERIGRVWIIESGRFLPEPLITFEPPFTSQGEGGLLGIALDPDFSENHCIHIFRMEDFITVL
jgi:glucose/arabinose dehydrogenase